MNDGQLLPLGLRREECRNGSAARKGLVGRPVSTTQQHLLGYGRQVVHALLVVMLLHEAVAASTETETKTTSPPSPSHSQPNPVAIATLSQVFEMAGMMRRRDAVERLGALLAKEHHGVGERGERGGVR